MATTNAPAKVNLSLHVTGRRDDGYHELESLVVFADFGDVITVTPSEYTELRITGPYADGLSTDGDNLVLKAKDLVAPELGYAIHLEKHLPVASGIGGGSADAAAVIRLLTREYGHAMPAASAIMAMGADIPVCLAGETSIMSGAGEDLSALPGFPSMAAVLVNPNVGVATGEVFTQLAGNFGESLGAGVSAVTDPASALQWLAEQRNDLQAPALHLAPEIGACLDALQQQGAALARMSGSGATCFGLFENDVAAHKAAAALGTENPNWWMKPTRLG